MLWLILIISNLAMASNWVPLSKIVAGSVEAYQREERCKEVSEEICLDTGIYPGSYYNLITNKIGLQSCELDQDCMTKFDELICGEGLYRIKNDEGPEVYCAQYVLSLDPEKMP